jgi:hypothetical protein
MAGFDPKQLQDLQERQNTQAKRMHSHNKVGRLIDYTYIQHLEGLISAGLRYSVIYSQAASIPWIIFLVFC